MKNIFKVLAIIAIVAIIGFSVTACDSGDDGTRETTSVIIQPDVIIPSEATQLTANTWEDGELSASSDEQWFKFTATASTQHIHADFNYPMSELYVQVYDSNGFSVGSGTNLNYYDTKNISRSVTIGQEYYIKVSSSYTGTYKIEFNDLPFSSDTPGITTITQLTFDTWADGDLPTNSDVQWFKFTATASTQYIHVCYGTLTTPSVQVYDSSGADVGGLYNLVGGSAGATKNTSCSVTIGQEYYIRVQSANSSYTGTYKIGFNALTCSPGATQLTADTWEDGELPTNASHQWFKFTATASTQYIHVDFGTLNNLNVYVYDSSGDWVGNSAHLSDSTKNTTRSVTIGQEYYIEVISYLAAYSGTYKIGFTALPVPPGTTITQLTADTWADGNLPTSSDVQLFKFTATASTQYIHVWLGTLNTPGVQVYDLSGDTIGTETYLSGGGIKNTTRSVTIGQEYYIRVRSTDSRYSGTYKIGFNALPCSPGTIQLTADTWEDGNLPTSSDEQWFKFTATASTHYIHADFGTLTALKVHVYSSSGVPLESYPTSLPMYPYDSQSVTIGQEYYIKVASYGSSYSGTYKIGFTALPIRPGTTITQLTANTWADGNLPTYSDEQWFKFTATASTQYIHVLPGTLTWSSVDLYDSSGAYVVHKSFDATGDNFSQSVTIGQEYYINVRPYSSSNRGTYKIGFTDSTTAPN